MKIALIWLVAGVVFPLAEAAFSQSTNDLFFPREQAFTDIGKPYAEAKAEAIKSGECRPAELDPQGNWSPVAFGFQLSIRSKTNVFISGQPIPVEVILRNTTTNTLPILDMKGTENSFIVKNSQGVEQQLTWPKSAEGGASVMPGRRQMIHEYDLAQLYSLKPDSYTICVTQPIIRVPINEIPANLLSALYTNLLSAPLFINVITTNVTEAPHKM